MTMIIVRIVRIALIIFILLAINTRPVLAQDSGLVIGLISPNEGETFYAGPTSMLYNIPIQGWIKSTAYAPEEITVELSIKQNNNIITRTAITPNVDGVFTQYATVNADSYIEEFMAEKRGCAIVCHYNTSFQLPSGPMVLEVIAVDPAGKQIMVERNIIVDRSGYASIPVKLELTGMDSNHIPLEDIRVSGSTRLYLWRTRHATATTNSQGQAEVRVEALAEAPTRYIFQVEPTLVNGVLYSGIDPVEIILPAGATSTAQVSLPVKVQTGRINGRIKGVSESQIPAIQVLAVHLIDGVFFSAQVNSQGYFIFNDIPISEYLIIPYLDPQSAKRFTPETAMIDLTESINASVELALTPLNGYTLEGIVHDENGQLLPFAWITNKELSYSQSIWVDSSNFAWHGLLPKTMTFIVNAPGYYSQAHAVDLSSDLTQPIDFILIRRPDTRSIPWGNGEIVVPPESVIEMAEGHILFEHGWLWGYNRNTSIVTIQHNSIEIVISQGRFALEDIPNKRTWLYIFDGDAIIRTGKNEPSVKVNPGQMVSLFQDTKPTPVPIDKTVTGALNLRSDKSLPPIWEPTLISQIRDRLAQIGVGTVQFITFITYGLILVSIVVFPLAGIYFRLKQHNKKENHEKKP